jgi:hypothetical protein
MKKMCIFLSIVILTVLLIPVVSWSGDFDGSRPLLCSVIVVNEITPTETHTASADSIGMPQFIMVDAAQKKVWAATDKEQKQRSEVKLVAHLGGKLIIQGADEGIDKQREAVSWTANISETTGKFILTAAGEEAAFAVFGACLPQ